MHQGMVAGMALDIEGSHGRWRAIGLKIGPFILGLLARRSLSSWSIAAPG